MAMETLRVENPFTPAFGRVPPYMAGREQIVADMLQAFEGPGGDPNLSTLFVAPEAPARPHFSRIWARRRLAEDG